MVKRLIEKIKDEAIISAVYVVALPLLGYFIVSDAIRNLKNQKVNFKTNSMNNKQRKQAVLQVANQLCQSENRVTTKEIKLNLHNLYPTEFWTTYGQNGIDGVSDMFHELVSEGHFVSVGNNGTFQTYASKLYPITKRGTLPFINGEVAPIRMLAVTVPATGKTQKIATPVAKVAAKKAPMKKGGTVVSSTKLPKVPRGTKTISTAKAMNLIQNNKGRFFTVTFTKKTDNTVRVMNAQYLPGQTVTGNTIKVRDAALCKSTPSNCIRSFDLDTAHTLKIAKQLYRIK